MSELARHTDPSTSHEAAEQMALHIEFHKTAARDLVSRYPGLTYRELYARHVEERRFQGLVFDDPVSLMRRLSGKGGVAESGVKRRCNISGRKAVTWYLP
ncbi:MAG: hypothetical protein Hals2KO_21360 [Halioglobus sp.]